MSKETKKLIVISAIIVAFIGMIIAVISFDNKLQEGIYQEFKEKFDGETNTLVYIGRPTCGYCNLLDYNIKDMKEKYNFDYLYINIDEVNEFVTSKILGDMGLSSIGTPYLAVVSNGKIVNSQNGYAEYNILFDFLQKNEIISKDATLPLNYISIEEYETLIEKNETNIIVVGESLNQDCIKTQLFLNKVVEENNIKINYFNITSEADYTKLTESFEIFKTNIKLPVALIVKDGKLVNHITSFDEIKFIEFLKENEVL